jgi:hypothetical protein
MVFLGLVKFFVIVAALLPLTLVALHAVGGVDGLVSRVKHLGPDPRRRGRGGVATVNRRQRRGGGAGREGRQPARRPQADRGLFALFWALSKPVAPEPEETRGQGSGRIRRAPAT